jgi:hypothetical protein
MSNNNILLIIEPRLFLHIFILDKSWHNALAVPQNQDFNDGLVGTMAHYVLSRNLAAILEQFDQLLDHATANHPFRHL